jgi:uncharacterized protein (TIGR02118 family)
VSCGITTATHRFLSKVEKALSKPTSIHKVKHSYLKEIEMAGAKLIVIYPRPTDLETFERVYRNQHVPMAVEKLAGKTKIVSSKVAGSPQGEPPFHRIAEIHFPTIEALQACAASDGGKQTIANAVAISSGGAPIFLVAEEETFVFPGE